MDARAAIALLRATTGASYTLVGRLQGGETGAYEVMGPTAERLVVKWDEVASNRTLRTEAVALAERVRLEASWPVPRQWVIDAPTCGFFLQTLLPGEPVLRVTHRLVDQLFSLHTARLGLARSGDTARWPANLLDTLTVGGAGYCQHDSLRTFDHRTAALIERIESFGASLAPGSLPGRDIVHWDLHTGNMLVDPDGRLAGIVDTDFMLIGDASLDLASLCVSSLAIPCDPGVQDRLVVAALESLGEPRRTAYLSHLLLRNLDWSIRKGRVDEAFFWLGHADALLEW